MNKYFFQAGRRAITVMQAFDLINQTTISCPSNVSEEDYVFCDIKFTKGTDLKADIDFGDGTKISYGITGLIKLKLK